MQANARSILLLAAEDAFEFERWRDAGPVTADIDPETRAAEVAEFEALGIPLPSELDSLRRELEHAPKVREAIRCSAVAMRRSGRASASSLVALGPQQLMHAGAAMAWGWPGGAMLDPRLDPRMAARMGFPGAAAAGRDGGRDGDWEQDDEPRPRSRRARERKLADATVVAADGGSIDAQVVEDYDSDDGDDLDDLDDLDDQDDREQARGRERQRSKKRRKARPSRSRESSRGWDDDDDFDRDDSDSSMVAVAMGGAGADRNTWILAGVSAVAVVALLWIAFGERAERASAVDPAAQQLAQQQVQQAPPVPAPVPAPAPAIDPNTGLPYGQVPAPLAEAPEPAAGARGSGARGSGSGSVSGSVSGSGRSSGGSAGAASSPAAAGGGTAFGGFKDIPAGPGDAQPAPAGGGTQPAPAEGGTPPPAGGDAAVAPGPQPVPATEPPAEQPKPAEPPKPEESLLTKSKMTPAIREGVVQRVGDLQACYQDAIVGKPDLVGKVVFVISLDQDGVVTKVDIGKDEVGYGVAKCSAKKIRRWTLPSAGIPIIFDLPFDFKS